MNVDRLITHLTDNHARFIFASLTLFTYLALGAVPMKSLDQVTLYLKFDAFTMPEALAGRALDGVIGFSDCCCAFATNLTSVYSIIGYVLLSHFSCCRLFRALEGRLVMCAGFWWSRIY